MDHIPYIHMFKQRNAKEKTEWSGVFALKLKTCPVERIGEADYDRVLGKKFQEHMDLINALFHPDSKPVFTIRYISTPNPYSFSSGKIEIILLIKVTDAERAKIKNISLRMFNELMDLLGGLLPNYCWQTITDEETFQTVWNPFDWDKVHLREIRRREDLVRLETMKPRPGMGRGRSEAPGNLDEKDTVYIVHKFIPRTSNLARILRMMLLHSAPLIWQTSISPIWLTEQEEEAFVNEITKCEQKQQDSVSNYTSPLGHVETIHQLRAQTISKTLFNQIMRLQDAPYLMNIYLASPEPIPQMLLETVGIEITAPVGVSGYSDNASDMQFLQRGGNDILTPSGLSDTRTARNNIHLMQFEPWGKSFAPPLLERARFLVDAQEAACAFRFPVATVNGLDGLNISSARLRSVPKEIAELSEMTSAENIFIGENHYLGFNQDVYLKGKDRQQHMYAVGQTGTGKTTLLKSMIISDMQQGKGVAVIDPHGDLFDELLAYIPKNRLKDVVVFNPVDREYPVGINLLECHNSSERYFIVREFKAILQKLIEDQYGHDAGTFAGPIFYRHIQMNMLLAMSDLGNPGTLIDLYQIFQSHDHWKKWMPLKWNDAKLKNWADKTLKEMDYPKPATRGDPSLGDYISSKLEDFVFDPILRVIFGQKRSTINFREIMDSGKILLVNLAKGELSETNSKFLGMILMAKIQAAAMQRADMSKKERKMFYLYVDEFQSIATQNFILLLSEARKFGLSLVLANQFVSQIRDPRIMNSIFGNVGTLVSFRVGHEDVEKHLDMHFKPYFDKYDLTNLPNWQACVKTTVDGQVMSPFSLHTKLPSIEPNEQNAKAALRKSRLKYGLPRAEVERQIEQSMKS